MRYAKAAIALMVLTLLAVPHIARAQSGGGSLKAKSIVLGSNVFADSRNERQKDDGGLPDALQHVAVTRVERTVLFDNIAHYRFDVTVGNGQFDAIRLHRVVRERRPYQPQPTAGSVFLLPGGPNFFEAIFMPPLISQVLARDHGLAIFLAEHDVDVWGMDYSWALVPLETTDFTFMKDWGVDRDRAHAEIGLSLARKIRDNTGHDSDRLDLLGFSYGGVVAYSLASVKGRGRDSLRDVKGLIIVDVAVRFHEQSIRDRYCGGAAADLANLNSGVYSDDVGVFVKQVGDAALAAPDEASSLIPGFTNRQLALTFGANTGLLNGQFWHYTGGFLDSNGIPTDLRYTNERVWPDLLQAIPPHFPVRAEHDLDAAFCGMDPTPFDLDLGKIELPILYIGSAGGFGTTGYFTTQLTDSDDVTRLTVQLLPDDDRAEDFGHADLMLATNADTLAWMPILNWIIGDRSALGPESKPSAGARE